MLGESDHCNDPTVLTWRFYIKPCCLRHKRACFPGRLVTWQWQWSLAASFRISHSCQTEGQGIPNQQFKTPVAAHELEPFTHSLTELIQSKRSRSASEKRSVVGANKLSTNRFPILTEQLPAKRNLKSRGWLWRWALGPPAFQPACVWRGSMSRQRLRKSRRSCKPEPNPSEPRCRIVGTCSRVCETVQSNRRRSC